ncbi:radical SAM protein [Hyperthermus butylicus]|uniref:Conserved archaeal protein n=1 Tax=Hyperthermus butylicus (strain DSM 5456 / JCM 9403 / PLM1-5) TaxID=415426 RepID=A2BM12_HYPBU|nr:radical SAM protein [Hyperthermus butylicus]ABM81023.1 conserved archaeal protein [Hyperthermus butylicus DSM 5456]
MKLPARLEALQKLKARLAETLEAKLEPRERETARRDHHAYRRPRPCGMTIHTGVGCNVGCLYCYVPDMGFPLKPRPYPLNGLQLVYALVLNPYFVPGPDGTLLAFGSVTEPLLPETVEQTIEYLRHTRNYLGNPQQLSTKLVVQGELFERFTEALEPRANILITITTISKAHILEPRAPPPMERFEFARMLVERGINVTLFLRPIIPGVTDRELDAILSAAARAGVRTIVPGSLRVTPGIIRRLRASRIVDMAEIERRLPRKPRSSRDQVAIRETDLKNLVARKARAYGLRVLPSSCSANIRSHGLACHACIWGPCGNPKLLPRLVEEEVAEAAELLGCRKPRVRISGFRVLVRCGSRLEAKTRNIIQSWLETLTKRTVTVIAPGLRGKGYEAYEED